MNILEQLEYQKWAEKEFYKKIKDLSEENWRIEFPELEKSLQGIYGHKAEVMWFWFSQIKEEGIPSEGPKFEAMAKEELFTYYFQLFEDIQEYFKRNSDKTLNLQYEWFKKPYVITRYKLLYNIMNHDAYHRGQIAFLFKKLGIKTPETDYNPYEETHQGLLE